ncbi:hypothetical protein E4U42_005456 [Claviceps africana]|uniref:Zn(2)-C6 fungal-type domain-containing protein n=1 Tax=Claviceps africana TaxID=83212 RepID=A0A8K0J3U9_9HYPO|nr:hypothetical protein E4U42_005456 [Claviceps africana]
MYRIATAILTPTHLSGDAFGPAFHTIARQADVSINLLDAPCRVHRRSLMDRHYVPLRRRSPGAERPSAGTPQPLETKRRRVGVAIACNDCRRRKIRCDGQRPTCSNCREKSHPCEYRDDGDLSKESKDVVLEVVRTLSQLPAASCIRVLHELSEEPNAWTILSTLRRRAVDSHHDPTEVDPSNTPLMADTEACDMTHNWKSQNPLAYPDSEATKSNMTQDQDPARSSVFQQHHELSPAQRQIEWCVASTSAGYRPARPGLTSGSTHAEPRRANPESETAAPMARALESGSADDDTLCDARLGKLNIRYWTSIDISDDLAARCISLYLKTDHPLLGHFDPELFVSHLVSKQHEYCSGLLINSMLYWACVRYFPVRKSCHADPALQQMYTAIEPKTDALATEFCAEAEILWVAERESGRDSILTLAAAQFLCMGYLGQGRDHALLEYLAEATNMAGRMGLFRSGAQTGNRETCSFLDLAGPRSLLDISNTSLVPPAEVVSWLPAYMGDTFPYLCWFWTIVREMTWVYYDGGLTSLGSEGSLAFAEFKFRELLAWTNSLPPQLSPKQHTHHHVQIMHRGSTLDQRLRTFASNTCSPRAICRTSTTQLKRLVVNYQLMHASSSITILWHSALIYVVNAILETNPKDNDWYWYLLQCLYGYKRLSQSWRVAKSISKGLLSLTIRKGSITSEDARQILRDIENDPPQQMPGEIRATFMLDLDRALSEPDTATVEYLANQFEDNVIMEKYTNVFDEKPN